MPHWLASESGSKKSLPDFSQAPSSLLITVEYKIDHISKAKNRTKKLWNTKFRFRTYCVCFHIWSVKTLENSKNENHKNWKINFSVVSELCAAI